MRILLVADSDSRLKWAGLVGKAINGSTADMTACLLRTKMLPTARQIAETGFDIPYFSATVEEFRASHAFMHYDVVIVAANGSFCWRVVEAVQRAVGERGATRRPVVVTGYVGVVYEKHLEGLLWRLGADLILINSAHDEALFKADLNTMGVDSSSLVRGGFVMAPERRTSQRNGEVDHLVFVVQPSVPAQRDERLYVLEQLVAYAERFPSRKVTVKLRAKPHEITTHEEPFHYGDLAAEFSPEARGRLQFAYGHMEEVLDTTDLCVTVSSTAALEALARGIPTAILGDFGIRYVYGNQYFIGSGCITSFERLLKDEVPEVDEGWLTRNGFAPEDTIANVRTEVGELVERQRTSGTLLPLPPLFYDRETAPFIVEWYTGERGKQPRQATRVQRVTAKVIRGFEASLLRVYRRLIRWAGVR